MKFGRSVCLATVVALSAWSVAACSDDKTSNGGDGGVEGGSGGSGGGGGSGGKAGSSGSSGSSGKAGAGGGSSGAGGGSAGTAGGPTGDAGIGDGGGLPEIKIDSPADGAMVGPGVSYPDYPDVPVQFHVTSFTLKAPASANCPPTRCGHVHLIVDDASCNDPATPTLYNAAGFASPMNAGLDYCKKGVGGKHTIILELHNNDHTPIKDAAGKVVSDSVHINATLEDGGIVVVGDGGGTTPEGGAKTDH
jgi:hypothetical protein